ncbi:Ankyrin repeat [Sesbania bispinosa]|nr:Ankyrin repeat [Sesbania bispinosa]
MAVPGRRNGMNEEDDEEEANALFEEEGLIEFEEEIDTPPHLRALSRAAQRGDVHALRLALDNLNGSIDEPVEDGDTALHLTCLYGHLECVQLLIERGANLEAKDEEGGIPLHDACAGGFTEIVQLLLNSANNTERIKRMLESVDSEGDTPLHHAARGEHVDVIRLLLCNGASTTKTNLYGKIPAELPDHDTDARRLLQAVSNGMTS